MCGTAAQSGEQGNEKEKKSQEAARISGPQPQASCTMNAFCRSSDRLAWLWDSGTVIGDGLPSTCPSSTSILFVDARQLPFQRYKLSQTEN